MKLKELADLTGGRISGNPDLEITGVSGIKEAQEGDITFFTDKKTLNGISGLNASAVIVKEEIKELAASMLIVDNPQYVFARALEIFYVKPYNPSGISDKAFIGNDVHMGDDVSVHALAYINNNVILGARVTVSPGVFIGEGVSIGDDSIIYPNVTIRENVKIGKKVIVHSGTVIGSDGYGYVQEKGIHYKIPQVGGVIIEDSVEIGANVCIDRATVENTIIGCGTKIDNLVQIAHNVKIGKNCLILGQAGISGSVEIGDRVVLAGQVGVRDHVKIGSRAMAGAQAGIGNDIPDGQIYSGSPAIPHSTWLRSQTIYAKLPEYVKRLQELERKFKKISSNDQDI
ncbi:UDP-3-O-acylglucosamine N-acyltransferase [bacterium BMS3Abin06]|nr:UDP-3-O-acylglucosamine N-acyltransferase [bacterium BMS3Abin06]HDZ02305.1 UDP-3-O-(3-hydroxymyristoyl)glucosamine N-acyltransferase [Nitrospirota bacterium]